MRNKNLKYNNSIIKKKNAAKKNISFTQKIVKKKRGGMKIWHFTLFLQQIKSETSKLVHCSLLKHAISITWEIDRLWYENNLVTQHSTRSKLNIGHHIKVTLRVLDVTLVSDNTAVSSQC